MVRQIARATLVLAAVLSIAGRAAGASFVLPSDERLVEGASRIVTGTIIESTVIRVPGRGLETIHRLEIDEDLVGGGEPVIELREWGGELDGEWMIASGAPVYEVGRRYLVFLDHFRDGRWTTHELALGRFEFVTIGELEYLVRDLHDAMVSGERDDQPRPAERFLERIREIAARKPDSSPSIRVGPLVNDLDTRAAAIKGVAQWSAGSTVSYSVSSAPASGNTRGSDAEDRIIVDDPNDDIPNTFSGSGTIAVAFFGGTTAGFTDRINITYADIVIQDGVGTATGVTQEEYATIITHELGHTLGFRHANQNRFSQSGSSCAAPLPCSTTAVMNSFIISGLNGTLQSWDKSALGSNYGSSPNGDYLIVAESSLRPWYRSNPSVQWRLWTSSSCGGPTITAGPAAFPPAIGAGGTAQLSVSATASQGALQFQWYRGASGNTSDPIPGATSNAISVSPAQTTSYWVRVSDGCGSVNSASVQVAVSVCEPVITQQPQNRILGPGESTTLSVSATNASSYAWYVGSSGNTAIFAGSGPSLMVSPAQTNSYWVRVSNSCGFADSISATVQVLACPPPTIAQEPADVEIEVGEKATLQVVASGVIDRYEWYLGESGDTRTRIGDDSDVLVLDDIAQPTSAWVRVYGECGFRDSRTARVRIVSVCRVPRIFTQPQPVEIARGAAARLTVEATGTSLIYEWWRRAGPIVLRVDGGNGPVLDTEPLFEDRTYFARVRNNCGSVQSMDATVSVSDCQVPRIVGLSGSGTHPLGASVPLSVSVDGTGPFSFQWYEGASGDVSRPISGATTSSHLAGPLSGTSSYWVRIAGNCGVIDSPTIRLHVETSRRRPARRPNGSADAEGSAEQLVEVVDAVLSRH